MARMVSIVVAALLAIAGLPTAPSLARGAGKASGVELSCRGLLASGQLPQDNQRALEFEVSVHFGEGEILALIDPETSKVETPLYDAEVTSGSLRFKNADERRIVWTRLSGVTGPLVGQAVGSDGDIAALSIDAQSAEGADRTFVLFSAADASLYRGSCRSTAASD